MKVLITGAAGAIGRATRAHLRAQGPGRYALRLVDLVDSAPQDGEEGIVADCGDAAAMSAAAAGMDAIVHLAVDPGTRARPERAWRLMATTWTVLEAARLCGVKRLVFASSNHAAGMATVAEALAGGPTPRPDCLYGICKVAGEAMARHHVDKHGLTALCIRIGSFRTHPSSPRDLQTWISPRDMAALIERGLLQDRLRYAVVYGFSGNTRLPRPDPLWETIGYAPQDDAARFAAEIPAAAPPAPPGRDRTIEWTGWDGNGPAPRMGAGFATATYETEG